MNKENHKFYLLVLAFFITLTAPNLLSEGMFKDGLIYAAIARNMATGLGSVWHPHFTDTYFPVFYEHPPLAIFLQSLFFRISGDSFFTERIYSFATFLVTGWIIYKIWGNLIKDDSSYTGWFVLLIFLTMPLISWAAPNNFLENTMMVFCGLSVLFILKSYEYKKYLYLGLAGLMLSCGWLCKGFTAWFPLSLPLWIFIFIRKDGLKRFIGDSLYLTLLTILPLILLCLFNPNARENIFNYLSGQVMHSISEVQTVSNRFYILLRLLMEMIFPSIIAFFLLLYYSRKNLLKNDIRKNWLKVFLLLGLSGVLPIMISMKQSSFYMLAALPYFAISLGLLAKPAITHFMDKFLIPGKLKNIALNFLAYILLTGSIALNLSYVHHVGNNEDKSLTDIKMTAGNNHDSTIKDFRELMHDAGIIMDIIPASATVSVSKSIYRDLFYHGYFGRSKNISLDGNQANLHPYFIAMKTEPFILADQYSEVILNTDCIALYRKHETNRENREQSISLPEKIDQPVRINDLENIEPVGGPVEE